MRRFTNKPELAAQDPTWEFVPATDEPVNWAPDMFKGSSEDLSGAMKQIANFDPQAVKEIEDNAGMKLAPETDPKIESASALTPHNVPLNRESFAKSVYNELGGDPWKLDVTQEASVRATKKLSSLWNHVFQGTIPWGGRLNDEQMKFWNKEKQDYFNRVYNSVLKDVKQKKDAFTHAMAMFEANKKDMSEQYKQSTELETYRKKKEIDAEYGNRKKGYFENPEKLVDDTRGFYQLKMKTLLDEDGFIKSGMEDEFKKLTDQLESDMNKITNNKLPSWLGADESGETITIEGKDYLVIGKNPDGAVKIKDIETGKTGVYRK